MKPIRPLVLFLVTIMFLCLALRAVAQESMIILLLKHPAKLEKSGCGKLNYPQSTKRFYQAYGNRLVWVKAEDKAAHTLQAMLLLDCVMQYGLSHPDYHPKTLTYSALKTSISQLEKATAKQKAIFDIMLTDAMISLVNHLHYGKLNPLLSAKMLDQDKNLKLRAERVLSRLIRSHDIEQGIAGIQPQIKAYQNMQAYLRLVRGQYTGDCYQMPELDARRVAINMERLRWASIAESLQKKLPAKFTYLTCGIQDGLLVSYEDKYQQDSALEKAMFEISNPE